jgi:PAS domain S-box-containing protein
MVLEYLRNNVEFTTNILSSIGDGVIVTDAEQKIVFMNNAAEQITDLELHNIYGQPFSEVFRLCDAFTNEHLESPIKRVLETGQQSGLTDGTVLITDRGEALYLSATLTSINVNNNICGVVVVFRDVSRYKRLELKCRSDENNLRMIFNAAPVAMFILDERNLITELNDSALALFGREKGEVIGKTFGHCSFCKGNRKNSRGCGYGEDCHTCEIRRAISLGLEGLASSGFECQKRFYIKGKEECRWFRASTSPIIINDRRHVALALSDLTDRKKWEYSVMKAQDFYVRLLGGFPAVVWRIDTNCQCLYVNNEWKTFTGEPIEKSYGPGWLEFIHPEDVEQHFASSCNVFKEQKGTEIEIRLLHRSGQYRWLYCINRPFYDIDGNFDGYIGMGMDITDRKVAEEALRVNEEKYRRLFNGAQDALFLVEEETGGQVGRFREVNDVACRRLGYSREEMLSMSPVDITPKSLHSALIENKRQLDNAGHFLFETVHVAKNGKQIPVEINEHAFKLHGKRVWLSAARDITERKNADQLLQESRSRYRSLFMNMHSGFSYSRAILDENGWPVDFEVLEVNDALANMFGCDGSAIIGKRFSDLFTKRWPCYSDFVATFAVIASGHMDKAQKEFQSSVTGRWISVTAYSPKKNKLALLYNDITAQKAAEAELRRSKDAAEAANRSKSEFLANMSHEIRTPINGMMGMIDLTLLSDLTADQRDNLSTAKTCAKSLLTVINDILDFSKMEVGKLSIEHVPFNLRKFIAEVVKNHAHLAASKGLALMYQIASDVPDNIHGDINRLRQVFNNLIYNALKFTGKGSVSISVEVREKGEEHLELLFAVKDTGIGIATQDIGKLFKAFSQVDGSITRRYGGTGLGLAISKQLVEMMDGRIWVESEVEKGSTFYFTIRTTEARRMSKRKSINPMESQDNKTLAVLVVEDDEINRSVIKKMLGKAGYKVVTACDGNDALAKIADNTFDVILMDIQMPGMDGIEATKRIRNLEDKVKKQTPIIALTAYALAGDKERFIAAGMDEYIAKPIQMEDLFARIAQLTKFPLQIGNGRRKALKLTADGEITTDPQPSNKDADVMSSIEEIIRKMSYSSDVGLLEQLAHTIKDVANKNGLDGIKSIAFKAELAARRENLKEVSAHVGHLIKICSTYQKTGILP